MSNTKRTSPNGSVTLWHCEQCNQVTVHAVFELITKGNETLVCCRCNTTTPPAKPEPPTKPVTYPTGKE